LVADLGHIAETSKARIEVDAARVPLSPALLSLWPEAVGRVVKATTSGDDYEIAFTAALEQREQILAVAAAAGVPVTEIGRVSVGEGVALFDPAGKEIPITHPGYVHF
jgi:thiamine-monophosphate kinase